MQKSPVAFVDVDTQKDFMYPEGALYVKGAEKTIPKLKTLIQLALQERIPIISSVDAHTERDEEFGQFPPHCMRGTEGQEKIPETTVPGFIILPNRPYQGDMLALFDRYDQVIVEKSTLDLFTNCNADSLVENIFADQFVVFGVATDYCVKFAVLGLLERGKHVTLVSDAVRPVDPAAGKAAVAEMVKKGARRASAAEIISRWTPEA